MTHSANVSSSSTTTSSSSSSVVANLRMKWSDLEWKNILAFAILHGLALYGVAMIPYLKDFRYLYACFFLYAAGMMCTTAGNHRLWSHRSYSASLPVRIILLIGSTISAQGSIIGWSRDHRLHHMYSETEKDPHTSQKGFFYSHIGWLLCDYPAPVKEGHKEINVSDLEADPILKWQDENYGVLAILISYVIPTIVLGYMWGSYAAALTLSCAARHVICLHCTWLVNSLAHVYGDRPYNGIIGPAENWIVSLLTFGEGWHNFHHAFAYDYKTSETLFTWNPTAWAIKILSWFGLTFNLRVATKEAVAHEQRRTGLENKPIKQE